MPQTGEVNIYATIGGVTPPPFTSLAELEAAAAGTTVTSIQYMQKLGTTTTAVNYNFGSVNGRLAAAGAKTFEEEVIEVPQPLRAAGEEAPCGVFFVGAGEKSYLLLISMC